MMADIEKLKAAMEKDRRFMELMPMVEEMLCRGSRLDRKKYAARLMELAQDDGLLAFTVAGGHRDGFEYEDPDLWNELEAQGKLTQVLALWNQFVLYRYWAQTLRWCPVTTLIWAGDT